MYRGKNTTGEWVYGDLVHCKFGHQRIHEIPKTWIVTSAFSNGGWFNIRHKYFVQSHTVGKKVGLKDLHGKDIYDNHIVEFGFYREGLACRLKGKFSWNDDSLRYELDIFDNHEFACLWYDNLRMGAFEIVGDYEDKF